jgi:hypothetical protein
MDVDSTHGSGTAPSGPTVANLAQATGNLTFVITPYNPSPHTPRGIEIVEKAKRVSPPLVAAASTPTGSNGKWMCRGQSQL